MFLAGLHAFAGHGPRRGVEVDFGPACAAHLAGTCSGQDREFEGLRAHAGLAAQRLHESPNVAERQSAVMARIRHGARRRQHGIEVALPAGGVQARAVTARRSPVQD